MNPNNKPTPAQTTRTADTTPIRLLSDAELDMVSGGLLLPAVQKVREAAARLTA